MTDLQKFHALLEDFDNGMLVTHSREGRFHARPMAVARLEDDCAVWFITSLDSAKTSELLADPDVCVTFQRMGTAVSLLGAATIIADRARIRSMWSKGIELWFPSGPDDPEVVAILVEPTEAEYWNERGLNAVKFALRAVKAFVKGERIDHDREEHAHTKL